MKAIKMRKIAIASCVIALILSFGLTVGMLVHLKFGLACLWLLIGALNLVNAVLNYKQLRKDIEKLKNEKTYYYIES